LTLARVRVAQVPFFERLPLDKLAAVFLLSKS